MKKVVVVLLLFIFPMVVNAKEDKVTINELNTYIRILDMNYYSYEETADISVDFGDNPNTNYYIKSIPKSGTHVYKEESKSTEFNINLKTLDILNDSYDMDDGKNSTTIYVGTSSRLLSEKETIKMEYLISFTGKKLKKNKEYFFDIAKSDYDIKKVNFEIILSDIAKRGTIYFSNNGKDYFEDLDGLTYSKDEYISLKGTYIKTLKKGESLSIRIVLDEEDRKTKADFKESVVYCSFGVLGIFISFIIYKIVKH